MAGEPAKPDTAVEARQEMHDDGPRLLVLRRDAEKPIVQQSVGFLPAGNYQISSLKADTVSFDALARIIETFADIGFVDQSGCDLLTSHDSLPEKRVGAFGAADLASDTCDGYLPIIIWGQPTSLAELLQAARGLLGRQIALGFSQHLEPDHELFHCG